MDLPHSTPATGDGSTRCTEWLLEHSVRALPGVQHVALQTGTLLKWASRRLGEVHAAASTEAKALRAWVIGLLLRDWKKPV